MDVAADPRFALPRTLFFGVGAQKAATTWLDAYLRGHPEVCLPVRKEQHYWSTQAGVGTRDRLARARRKIAKVEARPFWRSLFRPAHKRQADEAWRLSAAMLVDDDADRSAYADVLFQDWRGQPAVGEITPAYALLDAETYARMAALNANARFIFVMRDPVDRLVSGVTMNLRKGALVGELSAAVEGALADPEGGAFLRSRYDLTIARLEAAVPAERICYAFYETLFRQEEIDRIVDFIGVSRRPAGLERRVNAARAGAAPARAEVIAQAETALAPVYEFVRAKFGDAVPPAWRDVAPAAPSLPLREATE